MKEYKPVDTFYEDIYDFDEINGKIDFQQRFGKTYSIDEYGHTLRSTYRPKISDDAVRLPPVFVSNTRVGPTATIKSGINSGLEKSSTGLWNKDLDRDKGKETLHESVTSKANHANTEPHKYTRKVQHPEPVDHTEIYRSLTEGLHSTCTSIEKSPQVQEYERRNKIKQHASLGKMTTNDKHGSNQDHTEGDVFMKRVKQYEESIKTGSRFHHGINCSVPKPHTEYVYHPAPPTAPKPVDDTSRYNRNKRWLHYNNTQLDQDISVHNPPAPYHRPKTPVVELDIDFDSEVKEALRVQKELDILHKELEKMRNADMVHGMGMLRPSTAAAANSNLPGCSTPCLIPAAAVPYKSIEPVKPWNCENAKRGLGFRSKINREEQNRKPDKSNIPEKIRKEMKKYFG